MAMDTNTSITVSKRSVERFYYPDEPHFFRYFVKKPQRKSPLINRSYWWMQKIIDVTVRRFLSKPSANKKVIVSLGCGNNVLPWQAHARYASLCESVLFVDVDSPDLVRKKRTTVLATPQLRGLLGSDFSVSEEDEDPVLIRSAGYCLIACDLLDFGKFAEILASLTSLSQSEILFVAENTTSCMDTHSADSLIKSASSLGYAEFCLIEPAMPHGRNHPYAKTMLDHYERAKTTLHPAHHYPTVATQRSRFESCGWTHIDASDLWQAWSGDQYLDGKERRALDKVEPFDEWEEFMLFGRHNIILHAQMTPEHDSPAPVQDGAALKSSEVRLKFTKLNHAKPVKRRFGCCTLLSNPEGQRYAAHMFGAGNDDRSDTYDLYALGRGQSPYKLPYHGPPARMCSTMIDLGDFGTLLVGGRSSPDKALSDCWLLSKGADCSWEKTWEFPVPIYRHSATRLRGSSLALVMGGRTGCEGISTGSYVFHPEKGWLKCKAIGDRLEPTFGAVLCNAPGNEPGSQIFRGLFCGGIQQDGTVSPRVYLWQLDMTGNEVSICFEEVQDRPPDCRMLSIFGASVIVIGEVIAICGGIGESALSAGQGVTFISISQGNCRVMVVSSSRNPEDSPLIIGASVFMSGQNHLTIFGGGAACFPSGHFWEAKPYVLELPDIVASDQASSGYNPEDHPALNYLESPKVSGKPQNASARKSSSVKPTVTTIPRVKLDSESTFEELLRAAKPAIIEGLDLGPCVQRWNPTYMAQCVGEDRQVVVHECQSNTEKMDFNSKNFYYVTDTFNNIMKRVEDGGRLYLRSLAHEKPSESPANIDQDYPGLSKDFQLPKEVRFVKENIFSSILRISGRVNMWLHYDVMANIYTQIRGSKRMILFPPSDVTHLSFDAGASSSSRDIFSELDTAKLSSTRPHEAHLEPGDTLLLPPMWLHTATPTSDMSVAINVFFRDLKDGYSGGRDVYGNRDLAAYEKGRQETAKIGKSFEKLPREIRRFYLSRLADELRESAEAE